MIYAESKEMPSGTQPLFGKDGYFTDNIYSNTSILTKLTEKEIYDRLKSKMQPVGKLLPKNIVIQAAVGSNFSLTQELYTNGTRVAVKQD
jgi:hypothetical protein